MPRNSLPPTYRYHKARNCAVVTIAGYNYYLGAFGSDESQEKYARLIAEWEASGRTLLPGRATRNAAPFRVKDLVLQYFRFAESEYVDETGRATDEVTSLRIALRRLRTLYGNTNAVDFGPKKLKVVQQAMLNEDLSRKYINDSVFRIRC